MMTCWTGKERVHTDSYIANVHQLCLLSSATTCLRRLPRIAFDSSTQFGFFAKASLFVTKPRLAFGQSETSHINVVSPV